MQEGCGPATAAATNGAAPGQPNQPQTSSAQPEWQQQQQETAVQSCHPPHALPIASQQKKSQPGQEGSAVGAGLIDTDHDQSQVHHFPASDAHDSTAASAAAATQHARSHQQQQSLPPLVIAASQRNKSSAVHQQVPVPAEVKSNVTPSPPSDSSMLDASHVQVPSNSCNELEPCSRDPQAAPAGIEAGSSRRQERPASTSATEVKQAQPDAGDAKTSPTPPEPGKDSAKPESTHEPQAAGPGKKDAFSMLLSSSSRKSTAAPAKAAGSPKCGRAPSIALHAILLRTTPKRGTGSRMSKNVFAGITCNIVTDSTATFGHAIPTFWECSCIIACSAKSFQPLEIAQSVRIFEAPGANMTLVVACSDPLLSASGIAKVQVAEGIGI